MTLSEAIAVFEEQKPGYLSEEEKRHFIELLDSLVASVPVIHRNEDAVLLIPEPFSELYTLFLKAQAELKWNEIQNFNNTNALFSSLFDEYKRQKMRTNLPFKKFLKIF